MLVCVLVVVFLTNEMNFGLLSGADGSCPPKLDWIGIEVGIWGRINLIIWTDRSLTNIYGMDNIEIYLWLTKPC